MKIKTAMLLLFIIGIFSCNKSENDSTITMQYKQTKCADRWAAGESNTDNETMVAIETYFEENFQIEVDQIDIMQADSIYQNCEACFCLNGKIIGLNVDEQYVAILEEEGFFIP